MRTLLCGVLLALTISTANGLKCYIGSSFYSIWVDRGQEYAVCGSSITSSGDRYYSGFTSLATCQQNTNANCCQSDRCNKPVENLLQCYSTYYQSMYITYSNRSYSNRCVLETRTFSNITFADYSPGTSTSCNGNVQNSTGSTNCTLCSTNLCNTLPTRRMNCWGRGNGVYSYEVHGEPFSLCVSYTTKNGGKFYGESDESILADNGHVSASWCTTDFSNTLESLDKLQF